MQPEGSATARSSSRTASASSTSRRRRASENPLGESPRSGGSRRTSASAATSRRSSPSCDEVGSFRFDGRRVVSGAGTKDDPWQLKTPPLTSEYEMYLDERDGNDGDRVRRRQDDAALRRPRDRRPARDARAARRLDGARAAPTSRSRRRRARSRRGARRRDNPVGGWYGLKKGLRGRFGMYMPPLLEELGLAEVEHNPRNNRMRADLTVEPCRRMCRIRA